MADEQKNLLKQVEHLLEVSDLKQLGALLAEQRTSDIAEVVELLDLNECRQIFDVLETPEAAEVFEKVDEAIAMAVMYTANHLKVKAIIALTESGSTTLWMSRIRSDIPIYAFTPHEATSRRVTLYRGVYPVTFTTGKTEVRDLYREIFSTLLSKKLVEEGDLVIFTKGELSGVSGGTNSMQIIKVSSSV